MRATKRFDKMKNSDIDIDMEIIRRRQSTSGVKFVIQQMRKFQKKKKKLMVNSLDYNLL